MSIKVRLTPADGVPLLPAALPPAPLAPEPMPPIVKAFWHDEGPLKRLPPWRIETEETPEDRQSREEAEGRGCWTG